MEGFIIMYLIILFDFRILCVFMLLLDQCLEVDLYGVKTPKDSYGASLEWYDLCTKF